MATYTLISSNVLASSAASVTFSAIPATYTDLVLKISARTDAAGVSDTLNFQFGGVTSGYSNTTVRGNGSAASSNRTSASSYLGTSQTASGDGNTANTFGSTEFYIPNYAVAQYKPMGIFGANEGNSVSMQFLLGEAGLMSSNTAINSIYCIMSGGSNFLTGTSFYLYGISNA
jgi:hypothetical protein